jgi:adenine-specific DNA-methyltransferase
MTMQNNLINPQQALNKVFYNTKIIRAEMDNFKTQMIAILDAIDIKETEEFHKNLVISFLKKTFYDPNYFVNTKGRNDLVIHNGKDAKSAVGVIIEAKSPVNKSEMITVNDLNGKALQELVLYYLRERITHKNTNLKQLVVTNIYEWFVFDAHVFNKLFAENKKLVKDFIDFEEKRTSGKTTDYFYKEIAKPIIESIKNDIVFTHFNINQYKEPLRNNDPEDDKLLVALFKLISPEHLLKLPFANDNNTLDRGFYEELLHIIGLTEIKDGGKKIIVRHEPKNRNAGSLIENAIVQLESLDKISRINNPKNYGDTQDEILFGVALELCITWINRILFLKLLEAQIITYHKNETGYSFLNADLIKDYDKLNTLFFQVLAKKPLERNASVAGVFSKVPYLNSSLFEPTDLEHETLFISGLEDDTVLKLLPKTVIKNNLIKKTGNLNALEYLFSFLDAYDFATDVNEKFKSSDKKLINAAVLGLIFEKINGYKDGSFFTPSFITMYMCKETIRRAVVQKFNELKGWNCTEFEQLYNKIEDIKEASAIVNKLKICDPAVGSGHFLVSALNEIIVIKHELRILQDKNGNRMRDYDFEIINDELIIYEENNDLDFLYNPKSKESQRIQETLFHEKRSIIESCLFGVDINPNSVKICQLRLWIELLKNAYYHFGTTDLETFPNIDINIKCGNSLISRFALDADLKKALKDSKWTIDSYKLAVSTYQNATDKAQKREMQALINDVISNFTTEIATNDPKKLKLEKAKGDFFNKTNQTGMFELGKKEQEIWNKQINILAAEIKFLETDIEDLKNNRIYDRAFEWRFEFPQVLNDDGDFMGFDVIIGNPPYISALNMKRNDVMKKYFNDNYPLVEGTYDIYTLFVHKCPKLLTKNGLYSFIIPNKFLIAKYSEKLLENLKTTNSIISSINLSVHNVFDSASVYPIIINGHINQSSKFIKYNVIDLEKFKLNGTLIEDRVQVKFPTLKDFGFKIQSGLAGFQANSIIDCLNTKKENDNFEFTVSGGIDRYYYNNLNIRYMGETYSQAFVNIKCNLSAEKIKFWKNPKIIIAGMTKKIESTFIETPLGLGVGVYGIQDLTNEQGYYISAILNSKFISNYFNEKFKDKALAGGYLAINKNTLEEIPFIEPSKEIKTELIKISKKIHKSKKSNPQADTLALEAEIDAMVYQLYGLTEDEIKIVEGK